MTTKFMPQMAATSTARAMWTGRIATHIGGDRTQLPVAIRWHERKLRFRMLDVRRLRVLRELAARGTIAATADALGYTAPAVSQQLAALEREAGVALLEKNGRGRRLTPAGEELVARTEGILRQLEAAEAALERTTTPRRGRPALRGVRERPPDRCSRARSPPSRAAHPDLRVTTRTVEPEDSIPALKLGELDLVLAQEYEFAPTTADPALERTDLIDDVMRIALPADHPLAADDASTSQALEAEPWIAGREGSFCHLVVMHSAGRAGVRAAHHALHRTTSRSPTARRGRRRRSRWSPSWPARRRRASIMRPWPADPASRRIYAAVRAGSSARPAIAAMLGVLSER